MILFFQKVNGHEVSSCPICLEIPFAGIVYNVKILNWTLCWIPDACSLDIIAMDL